MPDEPQRLLNPCGLKEDERTAAKIWELLRRNTGFRSTVEDLRRLDQVIRNAAKEARDAAGKVRNAPESDRGEAEKALEKARARYRLTWERSRHLVESVGRRHVFAGIALQWLVPDPVFMLTRLTFTRRGRVREVTCELRPDDPRLRDPRKWPWGVGRDRTGGCLEVRGPEIHWQTSNKRRCCDRVIFVREWRGWKPGQRLFTCDTPWPETPQGFQQAIQFAWRRDYDSRPVNPITKTRGDSPHAQECTCFGEGARGEPWQRMIESTLLAGDYRIFAIPKTVLTKGAATAMGDWLASHLKKGCDLCGDLLRRGLPNDAELLGTEDEWKDWLAHKAKQKRNGPKDTHFYRRCRYLDSLVSDIYPKFEPATLLAPPKHRARGKKYIPKGRQS